jgi:hypothetical protein
MKKRLSAIPICLLAHALMATAQSGAVIPQGGAGHSSKASCVILKRMGPADQITSRLYSFGIRGKQFQYVEGKLPEGFPFHGRLTDHDVRNLQGRGAEVIIMEQQYTSQSLKDARAECEGMTQANPNQTAVANAKSGSAAETRSVSPPAQSSSVGQVDPAPAAPQVAPAPSTGQVMLDCSSTPPGADIEIDGAFVGNTPSTVAVAPGSHKISVKKKGFADWTKTLNVTGGSIHINAELEQPPAQ